MSRIHPTCTLATLACLAAALAACGGGGGAGAGPSEPIASVPPAALPAPEPEMVPPVAITGVVADGPLAGALVCYDTNDNKVCDAGEPSSAPTDADGRYRLEVDPALAGLHRVVAMVPATAVDKDTGAPVGQAFTLVAPASGVAGNQSVFVSPLTTLVQAQIDATGQPLQDAVAFVQGQAGLALSPMDDFTAAATPAARQAATVARLTLLTINEQSNRLSGVVGTRDLSGAGITPADVERTTIGAVLGALPAVAAAANAPALTAPAAAPQREENLARSAQALVQDHTALEAADAQAMIGLTKLPAGADSALEIQTPGPGAALTAFRYSDPNQWTLRAFLSTAADNTLDAAGLRRYRELRVQRQAGQTTTWGYGNVPERAGDLHWTGSAWAGCPVGTLHTSTPFDATGRSSYSYCGAYEQGTRVRSVRDVAGLSLRSVVETIRGFPGGSAGIAFADWGPSDLGLLGSLTLPAGSELIYQTNVSLKTAVTYDPRSSNRVGAYPSAVAIGGDARGGASPVCANPAASASSQYTPVTSLEALVELNPGQPCRFNPGSSTGERNDWWGNGSVSIGTLADAATPPAGTGTYYTRNALLRVGFVPGTNTVNVFSCLQRSSDGSARNCEPIGSGSYRIVSLGTDRAMHFDGLPAQALRLTSTRVFVERGGEVFFGFQLPVGRAVPSVRLNLTAANALLGQLGLPLLAP